MVGGFWVNCVMCGYLGEDVGREIWNFEILLLLLFEIYTDVVNCLSVYHLQNLA